MHVCALGDVAANGVQCCPSFFLRRVPLAQLLAPAVDDAHVDGELVADNGAATVALSEFDAFDLRRQLATLSHRDMRSEAAISGSRRRLGVRRDEPLNLCGRPSAGRANLDPCKLARVEESIDRGA
jgi:hypothetical protein